MRSITTRRDEVPSTDRTDGHERGSMIKAPGIVAITGPNGAGKSRLLNRLGSLLEYIPAMETYAGEVQKSENRIADSLRKAEVKKQNQERYAELIGDADRLKGPQAKLTSCEWEGSSERRPNCVKLVSLPSESHGSDDSNKRPIDGSIKESATDGTARG